MIAGEDCEYTGEKDLEGKACGRGIAKDKDGNTYEGIFNQDEP